MNKTLKTSLVALGLLAFGFAITSRVNAQTSTGTVGSPVDGDVYLTVDAGQLTIGVSGATVNLGTGNAGDVLEGHFPENSFYVSDLKGSQTGYYTTISVTDLTGSINGETKTIPASNVEFKAGLADPALITGNANSDVVFDSHITSYTAINSPIQYIQRAKNTGYGILGVYGDKPFIKVTIPAYTPATTYHGTITYTLYENN